MQWNFDCNLGNIKPGIPVALQLTRDADRVELDGVLPDGLFLCQTGKIIGAANWLTNNKNFSFTVNAFYNTQKSSKTFYLSVNDTKKHNYLIILTSGYESASIKPWT